MHATRMVVTFLTAAEDVGRTNATLETAVHRLRGGEEAHGKLM